MIETQNFRRLALSVKEAYTQSLLAGGSRQVPH
jgi:hypothetical protein